MDVVLKVSFICLKVGLFLSVALQWSATTFSEKYFLWTKKVLQKMQSFFFRELQLITILLLITDSYVSLQAQGL